MSLGLFAFDISAGTTGNVPSDMCEQPSDNVTQISLCIRAIQNAPCKDSDQISLMHRLS